MLMTNALIQTRQMDQILNVICLDILILMLEILLNVLLLLYCVINTSSHDVLMLHLN